MRLRASRPLDQIAVAGHRTDLGRRDDSWAGDRLLLNGMDRHTDATRHFNLAANRFTVALSRVQVAEHKERALHEHGQFEKRSRMQTEQIHVAAVIACIQR